MITKVQNQIPTLAIHLKLIPNLLTQNKLANQNRREHHKNIKRDQNRDLEEKEVDPPKRRKIILVHFAKNKDITKDIVQTENYLIIVARLK